MITTTWLKILNKARKRNGQSAVTLSNLQAGMDGSFDNVEFVDNVVSYAYGESQDWGFNDYIENVTITTAGSVLTSPTIDGVTWDSEAIKEIALVQSNGARPKLTLVTPERAADLIPKFTGNSQPIYWYIDQGIPTIIPAADTTYTLRVRYQGLAPEITLDNINTSCVLPKLLRDALVEGIYSELLRDDGDPEWQVFDEKFRQDMERAFSRNRSPERRAGLKKWRISRSVDWGL